MIDDCFLSWYKEAYPDLNPSLDDIHWELRRAYYAGWRRCLTTGEALDELALLDQEHIHDHR